MIWRIIVTILIGALSGWLAGKIMKAGRGAVRRLENRDISRL